MTSLTQKHIIEQNLKLQEDLAETREEIITLKGELQDLEDTLERTEKGTVFLKGLLNNISEQNKTYKILFSKYKNIFSQEQYVFFILITFVYIYTKLYMNSSQFPLVLLLSYISVSKYTEIYTVGTTHIAELIEKIDSIEKTIDPLHELIDSN